MNNTTLQLEIDLEKDPLDVIDDIKDQIHQQLPQLGNRDGEFDLGNVPNGAYKTYEVEWNDYIAVLTIDTNWNWHHFEAKINIHLLDDEGELTRRVFQNTTKIIHE